MVSIKIHGGIGNQLFQYAFIVGLKCQYKVNISLGFYNGNMKYPRKALDIYNLLKLDIVEYVPNPNVFSRLYNKFRKTGLHYLVYCLNERFGNVICEKQEFGFREIFTSRSPNGVRFDGYFVDFRYMINGLDEVKRAFKELVSSIQIDYHQHVAIHIRRGDYTTIMKVQEETIVLNMFYYFDCLKRLKSKEFILRIYTDDYVWAKSELPMLFCGYKLDFCPEHYSDIDSLWTMSQHNYLIGANSTYSLWAYYFGMKEMNMFYFPMEWASSIEIKGYKLFGDGLKNVELIRETTE
jgi:hypothetical protein